MREIFGPIFLIEILHGAEAYLSFSEKHMTRTGTQSTPILKRNDAWHLPKHFELDKKMTEATSSMIDSFPHLFESELKVLRQYSAAGRQ